MTIVTAHCDVNWRNQDQQHATLVSSEFLLGFKLPLGNDLIFYKPVSYEFISRN